MRKKLKDNLLEVFGTIYEAHRIIKNFIREKNIESAGSLLGDCQDSVLHVGQIIKDSEGDDLAVFDLVEDYCRYLYEVYTDISDDSNGKVIRDTLDKNLYKIEESIKKDIKVKREVVFVPYKASMWDSLESVWKAADADPECDAYVVPIPYYDRRPDHSFGEFHYEGSEYPDYVPVTHYNKYNFSVRKPDVIYFHNPYDDCNYVTSVNPRFYSSELKKYTDKLVYIPYFVLAEPSNPENISTLEDISHFVLSPGVLNADEVIVQSENMKKAYITVLLNQFGDTEENRKALDKKILGTGSPKFDKVAAASKENVNIPDGWLKIIQRPDGSWKKIVFYNTGVSGILNNDWKWINKIANTVELFRNYCSDAVLLWRPHPLIEATIKSMRPSLYDRYIEIKNNYIENGYGIFDSTADMDRAITVSDAYFGDTSSLTHLFNKQNKPVLLQSNSLTDMSCDSSMINIEFENVYDDNEYLWFTSYNFNGLFRSNKADYSVEFMGAFPDEEIYEKRLFATIVEHDNKLYFTPLRAKEIGVYDKIKKEFSKISYIESDKDKLFPSAEWNYYYALKHCNCIYFFPHQRKTVLKYDLNNNTLSKITKWTQPVLDAFPSLEYMYSRAVVSGNRIYAPISGTNALEIIDIDNDSTELFTVGQEGSTYSDICIVGNKGYLAPLCGTEILEWDMNQKKITQSIPVPNASKNTFIFRAVEKQDNIIYFFPQNYDKVIHIDLENEKLIAGTNNPFNNRYEENYICPYYNEGMNICIDVCLGKICVYSYITKELLTLEAGSVSARKIAVDTYDEKNKTVIEYINKCLKARIAQPSSLNCEDSFLNIKSYIESIIL